MTQLKYKGSTAFCSYSPISHFENHHLSHLYLNLFAAGFSFSSPIKQGSPGVVSDTNTSKALTQGSICSTGTNFTDKSASLKDMLNSSPGVGGGGFSFKPADSLKNSILDKFDNSGSKFSKPYQKPNRNSATNKLVNSDAGFGGFRPTEKLKQGSVMDVLGGSGFKPAEKLKSGSVMDVLGKDSNAGFSFKPADPLKKGSVMDILGNSGSGFKPASELKQGSVMDILGGKKNDLFLSLFHHFSPPHLCQVLFFCLSSFYYFSSF